MEKLMTEVFPLMRASFLWASFFINNSDYQCFTQAFSFKLKRFSNKNEGFLIFLCKIASDYRMHNVKYLDYI